MRDTREVYFNQYCPLCKYRDILEDKMKPEDPCWACLKQGYNIDSHKPVYFEEDEDASKESQEATTRAWLDRRVLRERDASD